MEAEKELNVITDGYTELCVKDLNLKVITRVKNRFALDSSIFPHLKCDNVSISDIPHKIRLIIIITSKYIKIRPHIFKILLTRNIKTYSKTTYIDETNFILQRVKQKK